jgi:uncharacterized protein GlcG (DUF336 family)
MSEKTGSDSWIAPLTTGQARRAVDTAVAEAGSLAVPVTVAVVD